MTSFSAALSITARRLADFPGNPFFLFADRQLRMIAARIARQAPIDRDFYDRLDIGLMCARELEPVDMEYCDAIYAMLEDMRRSLD